jgi:hypothetical protein
MHQDQMIQHIQTNPELLAKTAKALDLDSVTKEHERKPKRR